MQNQRDLGALPVVQLRREKNSMRVARSIHATSLLRLPAPLSGAKSSYVPTHVTASGLLLALLLLLDAPLLGVGSKDSPYMKDAKAVLAFTFRGEVAKNEIVPVPDEKLPRSLHHIVFGPDGLLYASSFMSSEVFSASMDDKGKWHWFRVVGYGTGSRIGGRTYGPVDGPTGLAVDSRLRLMVASFGTDQIVRYNSVTGKFIDIFINDEEGHMDCPEGLLLLPDRLLVASFLNDKVLSYHPQSGAFQEVFARGSYLDGPQVMLLHPGAKSIFISSYNKDRVMIVDSNTGKKIGHLGGDELQRPVGLAAAPGNQLLVCIYMFIHI